MCSFVDFWARGRCREAAEVQHDLAAVLGPGDYFFLYFLPSGRCLRFGLLVESRFNEDIDSLLDFNYLLI